MGSGLTEVLLLKLYGRWCLKEPEVAGAKRGHLILPSGEYGTVPLSVWFVPICASCHGLHLSSEKLCRIGYLDMKMPSLDGK